MLNNNILVENKIKLEEKVKERRNILDNLKKKYFRRMEDYTRGYASEMPYEVQVAMEDLERAKIALNTFKNTYYKELNKAYFGE